MTYPFPNFNGEIVLIYSCWANFLSVLVKKRKPVSENPDIGLKCINEHCKSGIVQISKLGFATLLNFALMKLLTSGL